MSVGKVTAEELRTVVSQLYRVIDTNSNGVIEKDELCAFFKNMSTKHGEIFSMDDFEQNWLNMDKDESNDISEPELYDYMYQKAKREGQIK